jgi:hypothetical protein
MAVAESSSGELADQMKVTVSNRMRIQSRPSRKASRSSWFIGFHQSGS